MKAPQLTQGVACRHQDTAITLLGAQRSRNFATAKPAVDWGSVHLRNDSMTTPPAHPTPALCLRALLERYPDFAAVHLDGEARIDNDAWQEIEATKASSGDEEGDQ